MWIKRSLVTNVLGRNRWIPWELSLKKGCEKVPWWKLKGSAVRNDGLSLGKITNQLECIKMRELVRCWIFSQIQSDPCQAQTLWTAAQLWVARGRLWNSATSQAENVPRTMEKKIVESKKSFSICEEQLSPPLFSCGLLWALPGIHGRWWASRSKEMTMSVHQNYISVTLERQRKRKLYS